MPQLGPFRTNLTGVIITKSNKRERRRRKTKAERVIRNRRRFKRATSLEIRTNAPRTKLQYEITPARMRRFVYRIFVNECNGLVPRTETDFGLNGRSRSFTD